VTARLEIAPRPPFRLDLTTWALRRRPDNAIDRWDASTYRRALSINGDPVAVSVTQEGSSNLPRLSILLTGRPITQSEVVGARSTLDRLLGLTVDLSSFATMAAADSLLAPLAGRMRGLRPPRFASVFEALVNGVACQQLSLAVGIHLLNRLTANYGQPVFDHRAGQHAFPRPEALGALEPDELNRLGFSANKARTIIEIARANVSGRLDLEALETLDDAGVRERLTSLRGIGRWTAEYVLLRGLGRLHVFPGDDVGAHNKLRLLFGLDTPLNYETVQELVARWRPYAGVVYFHLLLDSLAQAGLVAAPEATPMG
jgi:DNA-3-methyladenine glycosylase II